VPRASGSMVDTIRQPSTTLMVLVKHILEVSLLYSTKTNHLYYWELTKVPIQ
jgi:hypothetical protein